jgi:hypothetical protein
MAKLLRVSWTGEILNGTTTGSPVLEIFSNTVHVLTLQDDLDIEGYMVTDVQPALETFWQASGAKMNITAFLRMLKVNEIDPMTGHQVSDPTIAVELTDINGASNPSAILPITTSCKVTLDDGTRNRRARGGVFLPLPAFTIGANRRWTAEDLEVMGDLFVTMLTDFEATVDEDVVVYSRAEHGVFPVSRVRVGDVPDNIRTRKNALAEEYVVLDFPG